MANSLEVLGMARVHPGQEQANLKTESTRVPIHETAQRRASYSLSGLQAFGTPTDRLHGYMLELRADCVGA